MRKICLINQNSDSNLSLNIFSKLAKEGKRVLIVDLREGKSKYRADDVGLNIFNCINEIKDFRKYCVSLEPNLDLIRGHHDLNFQEFNMFYDLFKLDFFEKKFRAANYDYIILEVSDSLNLFTTNSIFYSSEVMVALDCDKQGHDFANKVSRFVFHYNKIYGRQQFISKFFPVFGDKVDQSIYTYLVSEFTSKLVSFPIVDKKNWEFGSAMEKIAFSLIDDEKIFDNRFNSKEKQRQIKEYVEILTEVSSNEIPLTKF